MYNHRLYLVEAFLLKYNARMKRTILHCDMNNFYASVECLLNPSIKNKPVAVCGSVKNRHGIVLAKNYLAKKYDINVGDVVWKAKKKCPDLYVVEPHHDKYYEYSKKARTIYTKYTDIIEAFGIDECWLDVTSSLKLFGDGKTIADKIRKEIKDTLGLTISVGVSFNKIFAKLGSDMKKPDATTLITEDNFRDIVWPLQIKELMGVGRNAIEHLTENHIITIGDVANEKEDFMEYLLGQQGAMLYKYANGLDDDEVLSDYENDSIKSVGHGSTTKIDLTNNDEVKNEINNLTKEIGDKLRYYNLKANGISMQVKNNEFKTIQFQKKLTFPTQSYRVIAKEGYNMFLEKYDWEKPVRMLTITAIDLVDGDNPIEMSFFGDYSKIKKMEKIDKAIDILRDKSGNEVIL